MGFIEDNEVDLFLFSESMGRVVCPDDDTSSRSTKEGGHLIMRCCHCASLEVRLHLVVSKIGVAADQERLKLEWGVVLPRLDRLLNEIERWHQDVRCARIQSVRNVLGDVCLPGAAGHDH